MRLSLSGAGLRRGNETCDLCLLKANGVIFRRADPRGMTRAADIRCNEVGKWSDSIGRFPQHRKDTSLLNSRWQKFVVTFRRNGRFQRFCCVSRFLPRENPRPIDCPMHELLHWVWWGSFSATRSMNKSMSTMSGQKLCSLLFPSVLPGYENEICPRRTLFRAC
jgi:hypothetical protein